MSSVQIKITGVSQVKGLKHKKTKAKRKRVLKKKDANELKKKPEYFTTQFTQRPTYIERPPSVLAQPQIDYRPMFDKLMLQQLLLQNKGQDFRETQTLATTKLSKDAPSITIQEILEDEEKKRYQEEIEQRRRNERELKKKVEQASDIRTEALEKMTEQEAQVLDLERALRETTNKTRSMKDIQQSKKQGKKNLIIKGGL